MQEQEQEQERQEQDVIIDEGIPEGPSEGKQDSSPPFLTGQQLAYQIAIIMCPSESVKVASTADRESAFVATYTHLVGTALDLIGFTEATKLVNPGTFSPWVKVGLGLAAIVGGAVGLRIKYGFTATKTTEKRRRFAPQGSAPSGDGRKREDVRSGGDAQERVDSSTSDT